MTGIELVRCSRVFDEAGRFSPLFDPEERRVLEADGVILAIGQAPDTSFLDPADGIELTTAGTIRIDPATLATTAPGIFAGGDAAFPPALVITAAAQGKLAARSIDAYLARCSLPASELRVTIDELPTDSYRMSEGYERLERRVPLAPLERRSGITEVETCFSASEAREQAKRCLFCHTHPIYDGDRCILCARCADICPEDCIRFVAAESLETEDAAGVATSLASSEGPRTAFLFGVDPSGETQLKDFAPYWRVALYHQAGKANGEVGTYGLASETFPGRDRSAGSDRLTDVGADSQLQYLGDLHALTAQANLIYEWQDWRASKQLDLVDKQHEHLLTSKFTLQYLYDLTYGFDVQYFYTVGSGDATLYGTRNGSPRTDGWVFEADWLPFNKSGGPWFWPYSNVKFDVQYTVYNTFNGSRRNFDGDGRNAPDNNTLYAEAWIAF